MPRQTYKQSLYCHALTAVDLSLYRKVRSTRNPITILVNMLVDAFALLVESFLGIFKRSAVNLGGAVGLYHDLDI